MNDTHSLFAANEIIADNIPSSYQPCTMYILLLMYQLNPQHPQFVKIHGTDFTDARSFCSPSEPTDHCKLTGNKLLDPHKIMLVEQALTGFKEFAQKHNLEAASIKGNQSVYQKKLLVEVTGSIKRYNKIVNYQKGKLSVLTKHEIIRRVKQQKDHHLTNFLQRLVHNCPQNWIPELNSMYGLDEIVDDIGFYNSQNQHGFLTQGNATSLICNHHRLLTDPPINAPTDYSKTNKYVEELYAEIKREDLHILDDTSFIVSITNKETESNETPDDYVSCNEFSSTNDHLNVASNNLLNSNPYISSTPSVDYSNEHLHLADATNKVLIKGFSPRISENYLIKNQKTGALEITDSFELYLKIPGFKNNTYTLSFRNSFDVYLTILGDTNVCLTKSYENTIKKLITDKFSSGRSYEIPDNIYSQYLEGKSYVCTSGFQLR